MNRATAYCLTLLLALAPLLIAGCGENEKVAIELSEELKLKLQFKAVERLREMGCEVKEVDDKWLGISGIMVRLHPEHFTPEGLIRKDVISQFRHLLNCFLVLDRTPISDAGILPLREINNLRLLSVQQTAITNKGLSNIQGIISLRLLRLNWTRIDDDGLKYMDRLPDLALLYLSGTKITDRSLEKLVTLKKLAALQFSHTAVSDDGLPHLLELKNLEYLGIDYTQVTDRSVPLLIDLGKSRNLVYMDVTGTGIQAAGVQELIQELPDCAIDAKPTIKVDRDKPASTAGTNSTDAPNKAATATGTDSASPPVDKPDVPSKTADN